MPVTPASSRLGRRLGIVLLLLILAVPVSTLVAVTLQPSGTAGSASESGLDRAATFAATLLAPWIAETSGSLAATAKPVPGQIEAQLRPFFEGPALEGVRYHVGWPGEPLRTAFRATGTRAVTLDRVIIFRDPDVAADPVIWAHELAHVRQFELWGVSGFMRRYLRDHEGVEAQAWQVAIDYKMWALQTGRLK